MTESKQNDCIFCRIARKDVKAEIVEESENFVAFADANPKTKGHTLVVPKRHYANILDMPAMLGSELLDVIKRVAEKRLKEGATGFNVVSNNLPVAGQVVMHLHIHVIPRYSRDEFKVREIV